MIIYSGTKKEFMHSVDEDSIAAEIQYTMMVKMGRRPSDNEFRAWNNSLEYMSAADPCGHADLHWHQSSLRDRTATGAACSPHRVSRYWGYRT